MNILRSTDIKSALRNKQRGFLLYPIRFASNDPLPSAAIMSAGLKTNLRAYYKFDLGPKTSLGSYDLSMGVAKVGSAFGFGFMGATPSGATYVSYTPSNSDAYTSLTATNSDPNINVVTNLTTPSTTQRYLHLRYRRQSGTASDITIFFSNSGHGYTGSYYKYLVEPADAGNSAMVEVIADMMSLDVGGTNWGTATVTGVRIDLGQVSGNVYQLEGIYFNDSPDAIPQTTTITPEGAISGKALKLTGTTGVFLPNSTIPPTGPFTVAAWLTGTGYVLSLGSDAYGTGWGLFMSELDGTSYVNTVMNAASVSLTLAHGVSASVRKLIVFSRDNYSIALSCNNGTPITAAVASSTMRGGGTQQILGAAENYSSPMVGTIEELAIWNRVLTAGEMTELYGAGAGVTY